MTFEALAICPQILSSLFIQRVGRVRFEEEELSH